MAQVVQEVTVALSRCQVNVTPSWGGGKEVTEQGRVLAEVTASWSRGQVTRLSQAGGAMTLHLCQGTDGGGCLTLSSCAVQGCSGTEQLAGR